MHRVFNGCVALALASLLVLVRVYEKSIFYDPLLDYFHTNFQNRPIPELNLPLLVLSTTGRYIINSLLSLAVIWFLYKKRSYLKASAWTYLFAGTALGVFFTILCTLDGDFVKMALFYTRRFFIHPILLFIMVAGLYYLKSKSTSRL
ncbi:exosortase F system-associated protein [Nonlabens ponticola]|uniref:Exosortase F system-associated protein n=1 Tax=Nonlabens ponticola TaxID=2496866 RepID=A0A3S9N170_9FLAO|nr:exosortase F system-associated protein [Nonlabens ponticola]